MKSVLREKHIYFADNLGEMLKSNSNRFWSFFRNKTKVKHYLVRFKTILLALQTHKVRRVYYKSVFKQVDEREQDQLPDTPIICEGNLSSMCFNDFDVFKILSKLDVNKACGPDNVSPYVLKMCAQQINQSLTSFFSI